MQKKFQGAKKFCFMQKDDMISFAPPLSVLILCVHLEHQVKYSGNSLSPSLCSASCLFNCAPMSINLPRVKQTPLSSPLYLLLCAVPSGKGVDARSPPIRLVVA